MNPLSLLLWVVLPYIAAAVFIVGHIWRYRYDKFGWTTRSSQSYENRLLRWGSPMFHFGILFVLVGHAVGLLVPREWLYAIGIDEHMYHIGATVLGGGVAQDKAPGAPSPSAASAVVSRGLLRSKTDKLMIVQGGAGSFGTGAAAEGKL